MIHSQAMKIGSTFADQVNGAAPASPIVDTLGFDRAVIICTLGAMGADVASLVVNQSDIADHSSGVTVAANITTTDVDGVTNAVGVLDIDESVCFDLNLQGKGRYLKTVLTAGAAATDVCITVLLFRASESHADSAAGMGSTIYIRA